MNTRAVVVRPLEPESDLDGLIELLRDVATAEGRSESPTAEQMRAAFAQPNVDRWVAIAADDPARPLGYAILFHQTPDRCYGDAKVDPAWRRRWVGRLLVDQLAARTAELGARYLTIDVAADNRDALRFLLSQGFRFRGDVWALDLSPAAELPAPLWPAGYTVRSLAEMDNLSMFVDLCNRTFADLWDHWENTPGLVTVERMSEWLAASNPQGVFVVFDSSGAPVAQCRTFPAPGGEPATPHTLDQPGVIPAHRDKGLHVPLALTAAAWLRGRDRRPVRLNCWGDARETIAGYEAAGFGVVEHEVSYVREAGA